MSLDSRIKNKDMTDKKIQSEDQLREYKENLTYLTNQNRTYITETERTESAEEARKNIEITRQKGEELLAFLQSVVDECKTEEEYTTEEEHVRHR